MDSNGFAIDDYAYDVFLSFRGTDTRQGFTDVLYECLTMADIRVFRDDDELAIGDKIDSILEAINSSKICIPIFSPNFAESKWCLREVILVVKKLKVLHLMRCLKLQRTPVFPENMPLEILDLRGCFELEYIDTSIGKLQHLTQLDLCGCRQLKILPDSIGGLEKLENLDLNRSGLRRTPVFLENMPLKILNLSFCYELEYIDTSIGKLQHLTQLDLRGCEQLKKLPDSIGGLEKLENLNLHGSGLQITPVFLENMSLKILTLRYCEKLEYIDTSIGKLQHLTQLDLCGCKQLKYLPESIGRLGKLEDLDLSFCELLVELPQSLGNLQSLRNLNVSYARHLSKLPDLSHLQDLNSLWLYYGCQKLTKIPGLVNLKRLRLLSIEGCESREILEVASRLKKLHGVEVDGIPYWYADDSGGISDCSPGLNSCNQNENLATQHKEIEEEEQSARQQKEIEEEEQSARQQKEIEEEEKSARLQKEIEEEENSVRTKLIKLLLCLCGGNQST